MPVYTSDSVDSRLTYLSFVTLGFLATENVIANSSPGEPSG